MLAKGPRLLGSLSELTQLFLSLSNMSYCAGYFGLYTHEVIRRSQFPVHAS